MLFDETEYGELRAAARREGVPVSDYVRTALRDQRRRAAGGDLSAKLKAVRSAAGHEFPTSDVEQMLTEIELGRTDPSLPG